MIKQYKYIFFTEIFLQMLPAKQHGKEQIKKENKKKYW